MKKNTEDLCDSLDAAVFSGDEFLIDAKARQELRDYMARWERGLKAHEETEKENEPQAKIGGLFVSVWKDGSIIKTTATLNTETGEIITTQSNIPDHFNNGRRCSQGFFDGRFQFRIVPVSSLERQYFENQDDIFEICTECHKYIFKAQKGLSKQMVCSNPNCDSRKE